MDVLLPDFLIIGAMKAGTTSLARDLGLHPQIFMPEDKEPQTLLMSDFARMRADYASLYPASSRNLLRGDASTDYAKRPTFEGIAAKAHALIGPALRIVYMRRDPVSRLVSQYKHDVQQRKIVEPIGDALRVHPRLIDYSRYDWQIRPWKDAFGEANVLEIDLEDFSTNRLDVVRRVVSHIGADPQLMPPIDPDAVSNSAQDAKAAGNAILDAIMVSKFYRRKIKPLLPTGLRAATKNVLIPPVRPIDVRLSEEDRRYISEALAAERQ